MATTIASPVIKFSIDNARLAKGAVSAKQISRNLWRDMNRTAQRGSSRNTKIFARGINKTQLLLIGLKSFILVSIISKIVSGFRKAFVDIPKFAFRMAAELESGLVAVEKTTGFTAEETEKLRRKFLDLAKTAPLTLKQLTDIAAAGGRMGIALDDAGNKTKDAVDRIFDFAVAVAKADTAIEELDTETIGRGVGRLIKLFGLQTGQTKNLLSALNSLSQSLATGADSILNITERSASAFKALGFTAAEALGLGGAISALGRRSEVAASSLERIIVSLITPEGARKFSRFLGVTIQDFRDMVDADPTEALLSILRAFDGLSKTKAEVAIRKLFGSNIRLTGSARVLVQNIDEVTKALRISREAFKAGISVEEEFARVSKTLNARLTVLGNAFKIAFIDIFQKVDPQVRVLLDSITKFGNELGDLAKDESFINFIKETIKDLTTLAISVGNFVKKLITSFTKGAEEAGDVGFFRTLAATIDRVTDRLKPEVFKFIMRIMNALLTAILVFINVLPRIFEGFGILAELANDFLDAVIKIGGSLEKISGILDDIKKKGLGSIFFGGTSQAKGAVQASEDIAKNAEKTASFGSKFATFISGVKKDAEAAAKEIKDIIAERATFRLGPPEPRKKVAPAKEAAKEIAKAETKEEKKPERKRGQIIISSALANEIAEGMTEGIKKERGIAIGKKELSGLIDTLKRSARTGEREFGQKRRKKAGIIIGPGIEREEFESKAVIEQQDRLERIRKTEEEKIKVLEEMNELDRQSNEFLKKLQESRDLSREQVGLLFIEKQKVDQANRSLSGTNFNPSK